MKLNQSELAELLGVSRTAIIKWGLTEHRSKGKAVLYDVREAVQRRVRNLEQQIIDQGEALTAARIRHETAQAEKTELQVEQLKGSLIPADVVGRVWSEFGSMVRAKLLAIPPRYKAILASITDEYETEIILKKAVAEPLAEVQEIDLESYISELGVVDGYNNSARSDEDDKESAS
jgi:phage terminase Nu1 subunit (DNA packaging protein)